ncbi:MAG: hypothetical protein C4519_25925 [Desulfobacteraceae bacterium]|nr:MAG: hypothetical protein C4519_25925 [Desulfobacteraceae bacterium]
MKRRSSLRSASRRSTSKTGLTAAILLLLAAVAVLVYFNREWIARKLGHAPILADNSSWQERLHNDNAGPETAPAEQEDSALPVAAEEEGEGNERLGELSCEDLKEKTRQLFEYLDSREYLIGMQSAGGIRGYVAAGGQKLLARPPQVVGEKESLTTILANTAHFYRVLGKEDIALAQKLLAQEDDIMEPGLDLLYQWSQLGESCGEGAVEDALGLSLPLPQIYEYAGYFLSTLGGNTYILRRKPNLRLLVRYYSVLILDRANAESLNRHGIDIMPALTSLIGEMESISTLENRDQYLTALYTLQGKYQDQGAAPAVN